MKLTWKEKNRRRHERSIGAPNARIHGVLASDEQDGEVCGKVKMKNESRQWR